MSLAAPIPVLAKLPPAMGDAVLQAADETERSGTIELAKIGTTVPNNTRQSRERGSGLRGFA